MLGPCQVGRPGRILTNVEATEQVSKGEVKFAIRQVYAETTPGPLRETHEPGIESFGVWLEPSVRDKFVRSREDLLGK